MVFSDARGFWQEGEHRHRQDQNEHSRHRVRLKRWKTLAKTAPASRRSSFYPRGKSQESRPSAPIRAFSKAASRSVPGGHFSTSHAQNLKKILQIFAPAFCKLIPKRAPVPLVDVKKLEVAELRLKEANEEVEELERENNRLEALVEKIGKLKDSKSIAKLELESLPAAEAFDDLVDKTENGHQLSIASRRFWEGNLGL